MNAICGMTKVLKGSRLSSEQRSCVRIVSHAAKTLLSLLNNVLDFSKIEGGKAEIQRRRFNLRTVVQRMARLLSDHIAKSKPRVELSVVVDPRYRAPLDGLRPRCSPLRGRAARQSTSSAIKVACVRSS